MQRHIVPAMILTLTAIGVIAVGCGATENRSAEPPLAAAATPDDSVAPSASRAGELTTGPQMDSSPPTRVAIPALKVAVPVVGLGQQKDGSMEVPTDGKTVGWYTKAPTPGSLGPAVLAGHVDFHKKPGTFHDLAKLKAGDTIDVVRADGSMAMFAVTKTVRYAKNKFPSDDVYGPIDHAGLRLITCGGDFDSATGHYEDNIVVYAALKMAHPAR